MSLLSFLGFSSGLDVDFKFEGQETRKTVDIHTDKGTHKLLVYTSEEPVKGQVMCKIKPGKKIEHEGIKLEFVGEIEVVYDRGNHYDFSNQVIDLAPAGVLSTDQTFDFDFTNLDKSYESYNGLNVRLRYYLKLTVQRGFATNIVREQDIWIISFQNPPELNSSIKMEVGIEDCLHIEFEYGRSKYHLKDVILGKIYFLLVRIKIKYMELALVKRESTGTAPNLYTESETLTKFEIMDGAPVRGESIPIRLFLGAFDLTPTYKSVHNKFSVKYFLNLVLVDEEDRRYFKQTDVQLWRKPAIEGETHKLVTVRDGNEMLEEAKKQRRKKRKEKKDTQAGDSADDKDKKEEAGTTDSKD